MKHPSEDTLLESVLELLEPEAEQQLQSHLDVCTDCRHSYQKMSGEIAQIGSIDPHLATALYPLPQRIRTRRVMLTGWLKVAALLAGGFLGGYTFSNLSHPEPIRVVPYQRDSGASQVTQTMLTPCLAEDTAVDLGWLSPSSQP